MPSRLDRTASSGPHILTVIDTLEIGGAQQHVLGLARGLVREGYQVTVLSTGHGPIAASFADAGIPVVLASTQPAPRRVNVPLTSTLVRLALTGRFDVIHAHLYGSTIGGAIAAMVCNVPLVVTRHSLGTWQGTPNRAMGRWALNRASAVIAVSREIGQRVEREGCGARVIPNGVPLPVASRQPDTVLRPRLGLPPNALVVGFVGRLVDDKDPLLFVETVALLARRCPSAHALMVGDGPLRDLVAQRIHQLGLEARFTLTGALAPVDVPFLAIDVLLLTSRAEGSPLVVLEAMAASRPVVGTGVGDVPDQIDHGVTGYVVRCRDPHLLAARVLALADRERRAQLGRNAYARVARHFTLEHMVSRTLDLYVERIEIGDTRRWTPGPPERRPQACRQQRGRQSIWGSTLVDCANGSRQSTTSAERRRS